MAEMLDNNAAFQIVTNPPSPLDDYTLDAVKRRFWGGHGIDSAKANKIMNEKMNAKSILKMILVLINDRSKENLSKWTAAIKAQTPNS